MTFEELMEFEASSPVRHEYIGGQLYAMAGGTPKHADIGVNLSTAVHSRLRGKPFRGSSPDQRVRFDRTENWYYPDFLIKCPPFRFHGCDKDALMNPSAVFEVLSPSTEVFDRTSKFDQLKTIAELSDYILVSADEVRVEHFRKLENGKWEQTVFIGRDAQLRLDNFDISVPLEEIYEDIEIETQPVLPFEDAAPVMLRALEEENEAR